MPDSSSDSSRGSGREPDDATAEQPVTAERRGRLRGRTATLGFPAAAAVASGLGGFALGHAAGDDLTPACGSTT